MELRDRLKELRSENRLSQARLASILGIPQTTYSNYETGRGRPPLAIIKKIAAFYGVTADELLGKNGTEEQAIAAQISALPQEERQALKLVLNALTAWTNGRGGGGQFSPFASCLREVCRMAKRYNGEGTIYKTKGKWIAEITIGYNPDTGKRISRKRTATTQREAAQLLEHLKEHYAGQEVNLDGEKMTFGSWLSRWFDTYKKPRLRENTAHDYKRILRLARQELGGVKLSRLTQADLQGVIFGRLGAHYRTAKLFRVLMKAALSAAVDNRLIRDNPAARLQLPAQPDKRPFVKPSLADWQALLAEQTCLPCWRQLILLEFVTGARISELLALKWEDVEETRHGGTLHIAHALILGDNRRAGEQRPLIRAATKTASGKRYLSIPASIVRELKKLKAAQARHRLAFPGAIEDTGYIFQNTLGRPINPGTFNSLFSRVRKKLGIDCTFHMLRHDFASRMKGSGLFDLKDIQTQLGHSTIQVTMDIYTHLDERQKHQVSDWTAATVDQLNGV